MRAERRLKLKLERQDADRCRGGRLYDAAVIRGRRSSGKEGGRGKYIVMEDADRW